MNKIKDWVIGMLLKKYALGWLVKGYRAAAGWRTTIAVILALLVFGGQLFGYLSPELADQLYKIIGTIGAITFVEKLKRYQKTAEGLITVVKAEAQKPEELVKVSEKMESKDPLPPQPLLYP